MNWICVTLLLLYFCRIRELYPDIPNLPVCSMYETFLQNLHRKRVIDYVQGSSDVTVLGNCTPDDKLRIHNVQEQVLQKLVRDEEKIFACYYSDFQLTFHGNLHYLWLYTNGEV